jgi:hypothetical protein
MDLQAGDGMDRHDAPSGARGTGHRRADRKCDPGGLGPAERPSSTSMMPHHRREFSPLGGGERGRGHGRS